MNRIPQRTLPAGPLLIWISLFLLSWISPLGLMSGSQMALAADPPAASPPAAVSPVGLPPYGEDRPLPVPDIEQVKLDNGMLLWMVPRPGLPKVAAVLAVLGGTAADSTEMLGMSRVLAEAVDEGTSTRTSRQIAEELQGVGAALSVRIGDDAFTLGVTGLSTGAATMLDVLSDVARNAAFPDSEVELSKENAIQALAAQESDPAFLADREAAKAIFGAHPYHLVAPTREVIQAITRDGLVREYRRRFQPGRALLVLVGDFEKKAIRKDVDRAFGAWKASGMTVPETPPVSDVVVPKILLLDRPGSVQSEMRVGSTSVSAYSPEYFPLLVANTILGGSSTSRLYLNLRESKGYTYGAYSSVSTYRKGGDFQVSTAVRNEVTGAALGEVVKELDRMTTTPVSEDEMQRAKRFQAGIYLLRNETRAGLAYTLTGLWIDGLEWKALADWVPKINGVTIDQVRAASAKWFDPKRQVMVVVGDAGAVGADLEKYGKVEKIAT